jgi:hypothetical protein
MKKTLVLLFPAVLAGCVSHLDTKDAPAYVYVDGLIADSAATISHTQTALNQTGPWPIKPTSPTTRITIPSVSVPVSRLPVSPAVPAEPTLNHVVYSGRPGPLNFPPRAGYVRNITVAQATQRIVPNGWSISWAPGTEKARRQRVSLSLDDQWPRVLNMLMADKSLYSTVDWSVSRVIVSLYNPHPLFGGH